jgi:hypothetical protein
MQERSLKEDRDLVKRVAIHERDIAEMEKDVMDLTNGMQGLVMKSIESKREKLALRNECQLMKIAKLEKENAELRNERQHNKKIIADRHREIVDLKKRLSIL